jgi:DNA-binding NtrC family response regulator
MNSTGGFREDLLYRLNLITLRVPPLRERPGDVRRLAAHFLAGCAAAYGRPGLALTPAALAWLERQPFPGNVRQLKQTIERAVLVETGGRGQAIDARELAALADLELRDREAEPGAALAVPQPGSMTLDQMERAMIANCLGHYGGNLTRVAEALGLSRAALYRRLEKYGLSAKD